VATLRISLKKITTEVKFAERKSALQQNNNVWKNAAFGFVLQGNPAVASPKEQLYEQMTCTGGGGGGVWTPCHPAPHLKRCKNQFIAPWILYPGRRKLSGEVGEREKSKISRFPPPPSIRAWLQAIYTVLCCYRYPSTRSHWKCIITS